MAHDVPLLFAALTALSVSLSILCAALFAFAARHAITTDSPAALEHIPSDLPGVSILKPCAGADDDLERCLASFCALRHPRFEILCGIRDDNDPALAVLERVRAAHPHIAFRIVRTAAGISVNPKVAQLEILERAARYDLVWISDSNTRVHPDTLASMTLDLAAPGVGMVLSPVAGDGECTLGAALDNLHISSFITFATYAVNMLSGRIVAPGKSTLLRKRSLRAMGGFAELGNYCAEDYVMIERLLANGEQVVIGRHLVTNVNVAGDVTKFYRRHFRWAQMHWLLEWGTALEVLLFPTLFAFAWLCVDPSRATLSVFAFTLALQAAIDSFALARLRGRALSLRHLHALAIRPFVFVWLWARAPFARKVVWRGNVRWLGHETRLLEARPSRALRRAH